MIYKLRMSGVQHAQIRERLSHLGPDAAVIAACGRRAGSDMFVLSVREFCESSPDGSRSEVAIGHDERAVVEFCPSASRPNCSPGIGSRSIAARVMVCEEGCLRGWMVLPASGCCPIDLISVAGDDLQFWFSKPFNPEGSEESRLRFQQAFGLYTTELLGRLSIAVVGCSGTGSLVVEQLARSGVGRLVLVDPERVETKNLNRILNTFADSSLGQFKVEVVAEAVRRMGFDTVVEAISKNLITSEAGRRTAECDVVFGCVDGAEGRYFLNKLATLYSLPYIDVGVRLDADGHGGISQICGTVHYLRPGGSSLLSRGAITMEAVKAEGMRRTNPEDYESQVKDKYIIGVQEDRPAVISVNMHYASLAVIELLARLHSFRVEGNAPFAQIGSSLTDPRFEPIKPDAGPCPVFSKQVGRGDSDPLLDSPYLSEERGAP
jgi:hypothetical protein